MLLNIIKRGSLFLAATLVLFFGTWTYLLLTPVAHLKPLRLYAQNVYDLPCPVGSSPIPQEMQTSVPSTGHLRANTCVDSNGVMTFQGGIGSGVSSPAPVMGYYLCPTVACPSTNAAGLVYSTPANTQQVNYCSYANGSPTVICDSYTARVTASVAANVATYTFSTFFPAPLNWASGNSITVSAFTGGDVFFNQTCTLSTVTATNITCPLVHANASSTTFGFILNTSVGPFVPGDAGAGKRIFGYNTCDDSFNLVANANKPITTGTALTIQTFTNSTTVQMSGNAANTVTISTGNPRTGCVIWGNPDDTTADALDLAMQAAPYCPILHQTAGGYMFTRPHFTLNPLSCIAAGANLGSTPSAGNIVYSAGFHWEGRGSGATINYMTPGFPESGPGCVNGFSGKACWNVPLEGEVRELQFTGGGNAIASGISTTFTNLIELDGPASLANVVITNFGERGAASAAVMCVGAYYLAQLNHVNLSGCGTESLATGSLISITAIQLWIENFGTTGIDVGRLSDYGSGISTSAYSKYHFICYDCTVGIEGQVDAGTPPFLLVNRNGLNIKWIRGGLSTEGFPAQTQNGIVGYFNSVAGGQLDMESAFLDISTPATGTGYIALDLAAAGTVKLFNTLLGSSSGGAGGRIYTDVAGSLFQNLGGNTFAAGSTASQFVLNGKSTSVSVEAGQVTCAANTATITYVNSYLFNPIITVSDDTAVGAARISARTTTTATVTCTGATDVVDYTITPNPI